VAITDWRSGPPNGNVDRVDVVNPSEDHDFDEGDDVYENFPGLDPVRW
jgi:hypothetical protein